MSNLTVVTLVAGRVEKRVYQDAREALTAMDAKAVCFAWSRTGEIFLRADLAGLVRDRPKAERPAIKAIA